MLIQLHTTATVQVEKNELAANKLQHANNTNPIRNELLQFIENCAFRTGNHIAMLITGKCYEAGKGCIANATRVLDCYTQSAHKGNSESQYRMGIHCQLEKENTELNYKNAFNWFKKSADQNYREAQFYMGDCYENGIGIKKNGKKALEFYQLAADQSYPPACEALGRLYRDGIGKVVKKDLNESLIWYKNALELDQKNTHIAKLCKLVEEELGDETRKRQVEEKESARKKQKK